MTVERTLYHFPLDPASRQVRLALGEKRLPFERGARALLGAAAGVHRAQPVGPDAGAGGGRGRPAHGDLRSAGDPRAPGGAASGARRCWAATPAERAETRRLMQWFDRKFDNEVNGYLLHEKLEKRLTKMGAPDLSNMRAGPRGAARPPRLSREAAAGARLAGRPPAEPGRLRRGGAHLGARLFRRHPLARLPGGQDLVHEDQVAARLSGRCSPTAGRASRPPATMTTSTSETRRSAWIRRAARAALGFDACGFARRRGAVAGRRRGWRSSSRAGRHGDDGLDGDAPPSGAPTRGRCGPTRARPIVLGLNYGPDRDPLEALARAVARARSRSTPRATTITT